MSDLIASLSTTTSGDLFDRLAQIEAAWTRMRPYDRRYWLVDAAMRLGWLASRARSRAEQDEVAMLTDYFRRIEQRV